MIGPYRISRVLGKGAMGIVYAGMHDKTGMAAAIKTVFEPEAYRYGQIRREIRALARLHHPGVVRILDHGVAGGSPWCAMEHLEGATLKDLFDRIWRGRGNSFSLKERMPHASSADTLDVTVDLTPIRDSENNREVGPTGVPLRNDLLPEGEGGLLKGLGLLQRVCETLAFLHGEGVIHRDLKPTNIFVRQGGEPVLVDFGLAEDVSGVTGREQIELSQRISGSPSYMSPEQIQGDPLDARSDLYSLGCILYELLTGQPPFAGSRTQAIQGHLERHPQIPSSLAANVPPELDALTVGLLTKNQAERLGYAETVGQVLARSGASPPPWSTEVPPAKPYFYRAPFVGGRETLSALSDHVVRASKGSGTLVLVSGESGAGKTRLALETGILARRCGLDVATGECTPRGEEGLPAYGYGAPLHPFRPLIEVMADRCMEEGQACQETLFGDRAAVLSVYFPNLKTLPGVADQSPPPPLPGPAARHRLFQALEDSLAAHLKGRSLFLVLDDLQWADEFSLDFLKHLLVDRLASLPLLVFGTFRSEERTAALEALLTDAKSVGWVVNRMTPQEVRDMTGGMLAMRDPSDDFVTFLTERSNGNPFFIAEYLRGAVSERVLVRDRQGRWSLPEGENISNSASYETLPLPSSLRQLIELRLSKLNPVERRLVDSAAVMGRILDIQVLKQAEMLSDDDLLATIDELVSRQIIEPGDGDRYRFVHDKIGEMTEAALTVRKRRTLNRRLANAYQAVYPEGKERDARRATLGWHWAQAREPERAAPHLSAAAKNALQIHSLSEAIALLDGALQEVASIRAGSNRVSDRWRLEALDLNERYGDALALQKRYVEARTAFERAAADARDTPIILAHLGRKVGKTWEIEHEHEQALEAYGKAEALLGAAETLSGDARDEWLQIALNRVWIYYWQNDTAQINRELEKIRPYVEDSGAPSHRYQYYMSLVNRNHRLLRYRMTPETRDFANQMLEAAILSGSPTEVAYAHYMVGFILTFTDDLEEAEARLFESMGAFRRFGDLAEETRSMAYLAIVHRRRGHVDDTIRTAQALRSLTETLRMPEYQALADALLGWAAWRNGENDEAESLCWKAMNHWKNYSISNTLVYPFQWTAGLVLIALLLEKDASNDEAMRIAALLGNPPQMHLPDPLYNALGRAGVAATITAAWDDLRTAVDQAKIRRYL
jgi:serine/threonine protein kinase/tetratricopeptide (TPR) repeat protein